MTRFNEILQFIEADSNQNIAIEPEVRKDYVLKQLFDVIDTYKPETIVKAGLGKGDILYETAKKTEGHIVVVEPSQTVMANFIARYNNDDVVKKIKFVVSDFISIPIDYYGADLLICIDYLDFLNSGRAIDEFRRVLAFEGLLFMGLVVLDGNDLEGIYDEMIRSILPVHNDFYLEEDLKTILDLNEFAYLKSNIEKFKINLKEKIEYIQSLQDKKGDAAPLIESNKDILTSSYGLEGDTILEPYFTGSFMRKKPE